MAGAAPIFNRLLMAPSGSTPPKDFSYPTLAGEKRTLGEFRGRGVLLSFFATWCPLCNEEMPKLVRVHEKYKARGLTVLAVSVDRSPASFVKLWAEKKKLNYPVLHDQNSSRGSGTTCETCRPSTSSTAIFSWQHGRWAG